MTQPRLPSTATLTDSAIQAFPAPKSKRACIRDAKLSQLTLLVGPRSRTWYLHATLHARTHRVRLGPWPIVCADDARDACLQALRSIYRGESPKAERPKVAPSLSAVLAEYLASRKLSVQASKDLRSVVAKHAGEWSARPVDAIDARAVAAKYRALAANQPATANRLLGALSALTRYAHAAHGSGDGGLVQKVRALLGGTEQVAARNVVIPDELQARWATAVAVESAQVARYFKALMLTGMRANELRKLPRSGWDGDAAVIRLVTTKNGKAHALPCGGALRALIDAEAEATPQDGVLFNIPVKVYRAAYERVRAVIGLDWHLHDMRRTFATVATRAGVDSGTVKRLMNHSASGVTDKHYVRLDVEDLRPAMQTIETRLHQLWGAGA